MKKAWIRLAASVVLSALLVVGIVLRKKSRAK